MRNPEIRVYIDFSLKVHLIARWRGQREHNLKAK